jgi:hypothetical protein
MALYVYVQEQTSHLATIILLQYRKSPHQPHEAGREEHRKPQAHPIKDFRQRLFPASVNGVTDLKECCLQSSVSLPVQ